MLLKLTRQKIFSLLASLLMLGIFCPVPAYAAKAKVTRNKVSKSGDAVTYNLKYTAASNCNTRFKTCLVNADGYVLARWDDIDVAKGKSHNEPQRMPNVSQLPPKGDLFIIVKAQPTAGGSEGEFGSWKFAFNRSGKPAIYCTSVKKANDNGETVQRFKFRFEGAYPKHSKIRVEIYNADGTKLVSKTRTAGKFNGKYTLNWNGYPDKGGVMCKNGKYVVKYWIENSKPKQKEVNLKF